MKYQSIKKIAHAVGCGSLLFLAPCFSFGFQLSNRSTTHQVRQLCVHPKQEAKNCVFGRRSLVSPSRLSPLSILKYKNLDDHEELQKREHIQKSRKIVSAYNSSSNAVVVADDVKPREIDLPKSAFIKTNKQRNQEMLLAIEMLIGKIAMITAACLFVEEVWKTTTSAHF